LLKYYLQLFLKYWAPSSEHIGVMTLTSQGHVTNRFLMYFLYAYSDCLLVRCTI